MHDGKTMTNTRAALLAAAILVLFSASALSSSAETSGTIAGARPPAVPLVTHTPFFSIWSAADALTQKDTEHWTGTTQPIAGLIRVDGQAYRVIGEEPEDVPALRQTSREITMTRSIYEFANPAVRVRLTFMSPLLPDDLDVLARPATYVIWDVASADGKPHEVSIALGAGGELAVNQADEAVDCEREDIPGLTAMRVGSHEQPVLATKGDDHRINWGYCYLCTGDENSTGAAGSRSDMSESFAKTGRLPASTTTGSQVVKDASLMIFVAENLGNVTGEVTRFQVLAYDELYSINYFGTHLQPYWRRNGADAAALLKQAVGEMKTVRQKCESFDRELHDDAVRAGGEKYAWLCALAYRQTIAGCGLAADANGAPLLFPKECFSNGCISTVDVLFPMCPELLLLSPALTKAVAVPVMDYAASRLWPYPYAPHDLGTYPFATGQVYGMGGTDADRMPVEESGNMLILLAALAHAEGNAEFVKPYMPMLTRWADYLAKEGFDPATQLSTDDFAGHLARNANLAVKAILGVRAMADLCRMTGDSKSDAYAALAKEGVGAWMKSGWLGDRSALAFGTTNTWSLKYNLAWDRVLGYDIFPPEVAAKEVAFYLKRMRPYGVPLDSRESLDRPGMCKVDWTIWAASLGGTRETIEAFSGPLFAFYSSTPDREAMCDWFSSVTGRAVHYGNRNGREIGFRARPVVGAVFLPLLNDANTWKKWVARAGDNPTTHTWASLPESAGEHIVTVVPTAQTQPAEWRYTCSAPPPDWASPAFDDSDWRTGQSGFGRQGVPGGFVNTEWKTPHIWMRRKVTIPADTSGSLVLLAHHDEDADIYINGVLAAKLPGYTVSYEPVTRMEKAAADLLQPGATITLAVHCRQTEGGQYIDVGIGARQK